MEAYIGYGPSHARCRAHAAVLLLHVERLSRQSLSARASMSPTVHASRACLHGMPLTGSQVERTSSGSAVTSQPGYRGIK
jgi:hypothetical protein